MDHAQVKKTFCALNVLVFFMFRGTKVGKPTIELNSQPVGMERIGKNVLVGCMDETLQCFTSKVRFLQMCLLLTCIMGEVNKWIFYHLQ